MTLRFHKNRLLDPDEIFADSTVILGSSRIHEGRLEKSLGPWPHFIFLFFIAASLLYMLLRAADLSIVKGEAMFAASQKNRFSERSIFPPRGMIYDRFGKALVGNVPNFTLILERKAFQGREEGLLEITQRLEKALARPLHWETAQEDQIFFTEIDPQEVITLEGRSDQFPGIKIAESFRRVYLNPAHSHILGYVGRIAPEELRVRTELKGEETVGKAGVEAFYDDLLRGRRGKKIVEVDSGGKETRYRFTEEPQNGSILTLTVDKELEEYVYQTLLSHIPLKNKGASVVMLDPRDGTVLSLVSFPSVDTNIFGQTLSPDDFLKIRQNPLTPLFNRALSGEFPSGSVIKPFIAASALEEKIIDPKKKIYDAGFIEIPNPYQPGERSIFRDWKEHGWIDFYDAIAQSANVYFYMIGGGYENQKGLGIERIKKYLAEFGFGSTLGIDLPGEKSGSIPDPELKKILEPQNPIWRVGDTYNVSIGQGGFKVTPLQMAASTAALANGGTLWKPRVLHDIKNRDGKIIRKVEPEIIRKVSLETESMAEAIKGMQRAVTQGTAWLLSRLPVPAAAKTGTAEAGSGLPHAWVVSFAPLENPEIAVVVMVEHAGEGSTVAVPITYDILKWYFERQ